jgi:hypothetical protein
MTKMSAGGRATDRELEKSEPHSPHAVTERVGYSLFFSTAKLLSEPARAVEVQVGEAGRHLDKLGHVRPPQSHAVRRVRPTAG